MTPKRGIMFFLLIVACAALAKPPDGMFGMENRLMVRKLIKDCQDKGFAPPSSTDLKTMFNKSRSADPKSEPPSPLLFALLSALHSPVIANQVPQISTMTNKTYNTSSLIRMVKMMRNSSAPAACYMQAFLAPLCLATLTTESEKNITSDDYDTLLKNAMPVLQKTRFTVRKLPANIQRRQNLKKMMGVLKRIYGIIPNAERRRVAKWLKEQIAQAYFNCTMRQLSDPRSKLMQRCKPSLEWLTLEALAMMEQYVAHLEPPDVDSSPKEQLCEFFRSGQFKSATTMSIRMSPSLARKFHQKFNECFSGKEFAANVDKLGILACHYFPALNLTTDLSSKLFAELKDCHGCVNPKITQLKKRLLKFLIPRINNTDALRKLGRNLALLSSKQLSEIPANDLQKLKDLGELTDVQWTRTQLRTLVKKLGGDKCNNGSGETLKAFWPVAGGLPICVLKHIKEKLNAIKGLNCMREQMSNGQLMALLQGVVPSEREILKLPDCLLHMISLNTLAKTNITSLAQLPKQWMRSKATYLANRLYGENKFSWKMYWLIKGVTCKMINNVNDSEIQDMVQSITKAAKSLTKMQVTCAARKLFETLEKKRTNYFKNITEEEMGNIPTLLLPHLGPSQVNDLPDSVCPVFLDIMEEANLTLLPPLSPSRPALTQRALLCLTKGANLPSLTDDDVLRLGPLLCELQPSQLHLLAPDVLNVTLLEMASCQHIPRHHRAALIKLIMQTFGHPSDWPPETSEALVPFLDENTIFTNLSIKPGMEDSLCSPMCLKHTSTALRKKCFNLTLNAAPNSEGTNGKELTAELIEMLGKYNVDWTVAQLNQMSDQVFLETFETLGAITDYSLDQLAVLGEKAIKTLGPVSQMNASVVMQLGCIPRGFSNSDLEKVPFSLDNLEKIDNCGWNETQMQLVWKATAKHDNLVAQKLDATEMVALSQFICGLNSSEIKQLKVEEFKDAVGSMNDVLCPSKAAQQLKLLAVSAFGNPQNWSEAQVAELGNIIAALNATELASLDKSVFANIRPSSIPHIQHLAALSVAQLFALGPDNAAMVTDQQKAPMTDEQRAAVEKAKTGLVDPVERSGEAVESGAPSLSVEGVSAFMTPALFLLMGFLLL